MEDINNELDIIANDEYVKDTFVFARTIAPTSYILVEDDYLLSSNEDISKYKNFSEYALPKDFLPEILNKKFTAPDAYGMAVTYSYYSKPIVDEDGAYVIDSVEYVDEMGQYYIGFADEDVAESLIGKLIDRKIYAAEAGAEKTVEYNEYIKTQVRYITVNADSSTIVLDEDPGNTYVLDSTDYEELGAKYYNYTFVEDAEEGVSTLAELRSHILPKSYSVIVYRNFFPTYTVFYHTGIQWVAKQSVMATTEPLNYAIDNIDITKSTWWADPAIKILLNGDDYAIHTASAKYSNFDLRSGSTPGDDPAALVEMLGTILDTNYEVIEDQQYLVSYAYYDGSNGIGTTRIIKNNGNWSEYSE